MVSAPWRLDPVASTTAGQALSIPLRAGTLLFGRGTASSPVDVALPSPHISKAHAHITVAHDGSVTLTDTSNNGCWINGASGDRHVLRQSCALAEGDEVVFGPKTISAHRYRLLRIDSPAAPTTLASPRWLAENFDDSLPVSALQFCPTNSQSDGPTQLEAHATASEPVSMDCQATSVPEPLPPDDAAQAMAYEEVSRSFFVRADGSREPLSFGPDEEPPPNTAIVAYSSLRASAHQGGQLTCIAPIAKNAYVVELCGRVVSEEEAAAPSFDTSCLLSFDEATLRKKIAADDDVRYIDCREHSTVGRFAAHSEAPNLELRYVASVDGLPRRLFLVALCDIDAHTALTWDRSAHYSRDWLVSAAEKKPSVMVRGDPKRQEVCAKAYEFTADHELACFQMALSQLDRAGSFAAGKQRWMPQPMLTVAHVEDALAWPLPQAQARQLLQLGQRFDRENSGGCRVPPSLLTWGNRRQWDEALHHVVEQAMAELGVGFDTEASLVELRLLPAGVACMPFEWPEAEKPWGVLELVLPSLYDGGGLSVCYEGSEKSFQAQRSTPCNVHWTAVYCASECKMEKVETGKRLSLVYALRRADIGSPPSPPSQANPARALLDLERRWVGEDMVPLAFGSQNLVYLLKDQERFKWNVLQLEDSAVVSALLAARHDGHFAFDFFLVTASLHEKLSHGSWKTNSVTITEWEAHPDLEIPAALTQALEGTCIAVGRIDGNVLQGTHRLKGGAKGRGMDEVGYGVDDEDMDEEEGEEEEEEDYDYDDDDDDDDDHDDDDDDDHHHHHHHRRRRRHHYYHDMLNKLSCAAHRDQTRRAVVLWPRRRRMHALPLGDLLSALEAAVRGEAVTLLHFGSGKLPDETIKELYWACTRREEEWTNPLRIRLFEASLKPPLGPPEVSAAIGQLPALQDEGAAAVGDLLIRAAERGGVSSHLQLPTSEYFGRQLGKSEGGDLAAWKLFECLGSAAEWKSSLPGLMNVLVGSLTTIYRQSTAEEAAITLGTAFEILARLGLNEVADRARTIVSKHCARFHPVRTVSRATIYLLSKLQPGPDTDTWMKHLGSAVAYGLSSKLGSGDLRVVYTPHELELTLKVLADTGSAAQGLAALTEGTDDPCLSLLNFTTATASLLEDESRRSAVLGEPSFPRMLLHLFNVKSRSLASASAALPSGSALVSLFRVLSAFDGLTSSSYREQLVELVAWLMKNSRQKWHDLPETVLQLRATLGLAACKNPAFCTLLQLAKDLLQTTTSTQLRKLVDWKVTVSLDCDCEGCDEATKILANPILQFKEMAGPHCTYGSHVSKKLIEASKKPSSGFKVSQSNTYNHVRLLITKDSAGRTPTHQIPALQAEHKARLKKLSRLSQLGELEEELEEPPQQQPVLDTQTYETLYAALQTGHECADALAHELATAAVSPEADAAAMDPSVAALKAAMSMNVSARGDDESVVVAPMQGDELIRWVCDFFPADIQTEVSAAIKEAQLAELAVLLTMSHAELSLCLTEGAGTPQSDPKLFLCVRHLWLDLQRLASGASARPAGLSAGPTEAWLQARLGRPLALSCEELHLDGAALCSLSREEWMQLAQVLVEDFANEQPRCLSIWHEHISIAAAVAARSPARTIDFLPQPAKGTPFSVIVAGDTGTGKSTLLNALLGFELLPTSCCRACTASIIDMEWPSSPSSQGVWSATVYFIPHDDWRASVEAGCAAASRAGRGKAPTEADEGFIAYSKVVSVYGRSINLESPDALMAHEQVAGCLGQSVEVRAGDVSELSQLTRPYMDSADDAATGALWPLVRRVVLRGPFAVCAPSELCPSGLRLSDAPGLHDDNAARDGVLRSVLSESHALLIVSNIRRACNDKGAKGLMSLPLRNALLGSGFAGGLAFVATQTDLLTPSELIENMRLPADSSSLACALARNAFTKSSVTRDFYADTSSELLPCKREPPKHWEARRFELPVFTISARDYQILSGMRPDDGKPHVFTSMEQTEVPALTRYLQLASAAHSRRVLKDPASAETARVGALLMENLDKKHDPAAVPSPVPGASGVSEAPAVQKPPAPSPAPKASPAGPALAIPTKAPAMQKPPAPSPAPKASPAGPALAIPSKAPAVQKPPAPSPAPKASPAGPALAIPTKAPAMQKPPAPTPAPKAASSRALVIPTKAPAIQKPPAPTPAPRSASRPALAIPAAPEAPGASATPAPGPALQMGKKRSGAANCAKVPSKRVATSCVVIDLVSD